MGDAERQTRRYSTLGGWLCLDFVNTVDWHASERLASELIEDYVDLVAWARQMGALADGEADHLLAEAARRPAPAAAAYIQAVALREALYRIFSAAAGGRAPQAADLATLNDALSAALARLRIASTGDGFAWQWAGDRDALDRLLWPVVRSAADLLTGRELERVRECANDPCGWLFLDTSRNRSRRWCDMQGCGNRVKARRHYQRVRASRE